MITLGYFALKNSTSPVRWNFKLSDVTVKLRRVEIAHFSLNTVNCP